MANRRAGAATKPTIEVSGTDGNVLLPRRMTFATPARPVVIWNKTGGGRAIYVKINTTAALDFGGGSDDGVGYFPVNDGSSVEITMGALVSIENVSFVTINAADDLDDVQVTGWTA